MKLAGQKAKKPSSVLVVDMGTCSCRLLQVQKRGEKLIVTQAISRVLADEVRENRTQEQMAAVMSQLVSEAKIKEKHKQVHLTLNCPSTLVRYVETPVMTLQDMRRAIRLNAMAYLRQDCSDYFLDCAALPQTVAPTHAKTVTKMNVLVAGARKGDVQPLMQAAQQAGLHIKALTLNPVTVINAFETCWGDSFHADIVAVVDIGFRSSSVNILQNGVPLLTRLVDWGGDEISQYVAQMLSVEWKAAEEEKLKMSEPVQPLVRDGLLKLGKHIRSSLDFFETQSGLATSRVGLSGASAHSDWIVKSLGEILGLPCLPWSNGTAVELTGAANQAQGSKGLGPEWASAMGAAVSFLNQ